MAYIPEDPVWDATINVWLHTKRKCARCGAQYMAIDNVGAWRCEQFVYDQHARRYTKIAADHSHVRSRTYSIIDDVVIPVSAMPFMKGRFTPKAVVPGPVEVKQPDGTMRAFPAVKLRRYDHATWLDIYYGRGEEGTRY